MKNLIVQKYGGSSLKTLEQIKSIAQDIAHAHKSGKNLIAVVSAMGDTTNELTRMAYEVSENPAPRELDMLLTSGERVSMSLLSLAINNLGVPAISFTGSQAGIMTTSDHSNANIESVKPFRLEKSLTNNVVVVLAGYQGVNPVTKEVTTLGRGGSDTTAVAMAAHFKAARCEFRKDVPGLMSADPHICSEAQLIEKIDYKGLYELCYFGARILHTKAIDYAQSHEIPLYIGLCGSEDIGTEVNNFSECNYFSFNTIPQIVQFTVKGSSEESTKKGFCNWLVSKCISPHHFIHIEPQQKNSYSVYTPLTRENLNSLKLEVHGDISIENENLSLVSATSSQQHIDGLEKALMALNLDVKKSEAFSNTLFGFCLPKKAKSSIESLHKKFVPFKG